MPLVLISLAVIILDRVTKILVQSHLAEGESIPVVPGVMSLTYILKPFSWAGPWETSSTASKRALSLTFLTFIFGPSSMWPISLFV